MLPFYA
jgi:hypothetical protein